MSPGSARVEATGAVRGALRFARYALAPNRLGYCGPSDTGALFEQAVELGRSQPSSRFPGREPMGWPRSASSVADLTGGLRTIAQGFEGAWPYLELIAGANHIRDPLDDAVVAAYWLGGPLLERVGAHAAGLHVQQRFASRAGRWWSEVSAALEPGVAPGHAFHVMVVGPWVGMMRSGHTDTPLSVMDRCRIRRARVLEVHGCEALVSTDRIAFRSGVLFVDGGQTGGVIERVLLGEDDVHPCGDVQPGDIVTVHWDWVCEVVDSATSRCLAAAELAALGSANRALASAGTVDLGG